MRALARLSSDATSSCIATGIALLAMSGGVQASCTGAGSGSIECVSPPVDTGLQDFTFAGGSESISATRWQLTNGLLNAPVSAAGANSAFVGSEVTISNATGLAGRGAIHIAATGLGGNASLQIENSAIQSGANAQGLATHASNGSGSATTVATNTSVTLASNASGAAVVALANGTGGATIEFLGGSVVTNGVNTIGLNATSQGGGNVRIVARDGTIETRGSGAAHSIFAQASGAGTVFIDNGDALTTSGTTASGINVLGVNGQVDVRNSGSIATSGGTAHAILGTATGASNLSIANTGGLSTAAGSNAYGIRAISTGTGSVTVSSAADIAINGTNARAIYAESGPNGAGNASISMQGGNVTNVGANAASHGLEAQARGTGAASIVVSGGSVSTNAGSAVIVQTGGSANSVGSITISTLAGTSLTSTLSNGISATGARASGGSTLVVDSHSDIRAGGRGISASSTDAPVTVSQAGGSIVSGAAGIVASSAGNVSLTNSAPVTTTGANGANALQTSSVGGLQNIANSGTLNTVGSSSHGILAQATAAGGGELQISNTGAITTTGNGSYGISAQQLRASSLGPVTVSNTGGINVGGTGGARGIWATNVGTGDTTITGSGDLDITNAANALGYGALAQSVAGASVIDYAGRVTTRGLDASGLRAVPGPSGNALVRYSGARVEVFGDNSDALVAFTQGGTARVEAQGEIYARANGGSGSTAYGLLAITTRGAAQVAFDGSLIDVDGNISSSILARSRTGSGGSSGTIVVDSNGQLIARGTSGAGIRTQSEQGRQDIVNHGAITTFREGSVGIDAVTTAGGGIAINNSGAIQAGDGSAGGNVGIRAVAAGVVAIEVSNAGTVSTLGTGESPALSVLSGGGAVSLGNTAALSTVGAQSAGISVASGVAVTLSDPDPDPSGETAPPPQLVFVPPAAPGSIAVDNGGSITTSGVSSDGIAASAPGGTVDVQHAGAAITTNGAASAAIRALGGTSATVSLGSGAMLSGGGGDGAGVITSAALQTVTSAGTIGALSDHALIADADGIAGGIQIANLAGGRITGTVTATASTVQIDNRGQWNLRNFADTDGDGVRETLSVAVSDLGSSTLNGIANTGTLALLTHDGSASILDTRGQYLPFGNAANAIALNSPAQGQLLGVQRFQHSGVIDLQVNPSAGDVLIISGGHTPGVSGGGVFASSGGRLLLDSVLNAGGTSSVSDVLVVDTTAVSGGATLISVANKGGQGAQTVGDGIPLVQVLDRSASAAAAFALEGRVVAGAFDYLLFQGGSVANGGDSGNGNWYLRSEAPAPPPPLPPTPPVPPSPPVPRPDPCATGCPTPVPLFRPEIGAYLANQAAAAGMFQMTLHDRLGEVDFSERQRRSDGHPGAAWARVHTSQFNSDAGRGQIAASTHVDVVQVGAELDHWNEDHDRRYHLGAMAGSGRATTLATSSVTGFESQGRVKGTHIGLYGTWYGSASKPTGPYVDAWLLYERFDNRLLGEGLPAENYDSRGWTASIEGGWAYLAHESDRNGYFLEPQVQVIHTDIDTDDLRERNGTHVQSVEGGGLVTRVGVRGYIRPVGVAEYRVQPFMGIHWWHTSNEHAFTFNDNRQVLRRARDHYELKVGAQMELGHSWTGWGQLSLLFSQHGRADAAAMLGLKRGW